MGRWWCCPAEHQPPGRVFLLPEGDRGKAKRKRPYRGFTTHSLTHSHGSSTFLLRERKGRSESLFSIHGFV
ncbi:hypothetical protein E2C01_081032 [Portunus trituberculatus]|uniref:Uncharacterized protein n=1 Tax=Portunus trituberculatus TaxID=210409 RepID=A0A5B7IV64_PORTR|nr:hypothetical protein [Portunus trituberculatus]